MFTIPVPQQDADTPRRMWIILGIGNPGARYTETRHNVGFWVLDELHNRASTVRSEKGKAPAHTVIADLNGERVVLGWPTTYVNCSGIAAKFLLAKYRSDADKLIVITDDINLAVGNIRVRRAGSHGGHNGLCSVIEVLGTEGFARIRVGVGKPRSPMERVDYVLARPADSEMVQVRDACLRAAEATSTLVCSGVDMAMNRFNHSIQP